jgi:hypothetical protein
LADSINPVNDSQNAIALRRLQLEARVGEAIARAQKQYIQVQKQPAEAPTKNGPVHLGTRIDLRA